MKYALVFSPRSVLRTLEDMKPQVDQTAIAAAVEELTSDPFRRDLDVRKLEGRGGFRLRARSWRVLHRLDTDQRVVTITAISNRRDAYRY